MKVGVRSGRHRFVIRVSLTQFQALEVSSYTLDCLPISKEEERGDRRRAWATGYWSAIFR